MESGNKKLYSILKTLASKMGSQDLEFKVEVPKVKSHGDLASNIALAMFPQIKNKKSNLKSAIDLANEIVNILNSEFLIHNSDFDKIEVIAPGFINFSFSDKYLQNQVQNIIDQGKNYGSNKIGQGKKVSVEFVSANPTGPLHIGNARGGPLGDILANVLSFCSYKVTREYLHNDVGGQVARLGEAIYFTLHPDQKPQNYAEQYQGEYVKELAQDIEEQMQQNEDEDLSQDRFIEKAGRIAVEIMLLDILKDCESMGIKFDKVTKESNLRKKVDGSLSKIKKFLKEKEGALWFAPQLRQGSAGQANDEFLKDRETVVRKSNGEYTYFASDIAYHDAKLSENDFIVDILGANHSGHVPRLKAVAKTLGFDPENLKVVLYQWIRLKRGSEILKMSKRAGTFVTAREVLDEVGKDAFRFFLAIPNSQTHMDFDLALAKKRASDNPVFYVQYAYTRISSIFSKQETRSSKLETENLKLLKEKEEMDLIRYLIQFPELIESISTNLEVNVLTTFAMGVADLFHKFYEKHKVISDDKKLTDARFMLLSATQITLKNTLDLLGVSAPEKM